MRLAHRTTPALMAVSLFVLAACGKPTPPPEPSGPAVTTPPPGSDAAANTETLDASRKAPVASTGLTGSGESLEPAAAGTTPAAAAGSIRVAMKLIDDQGSGADAGTVTLSESGSGLVAKLDLKGLPPGDHGFHVHQNPDCGPKLNDGKPTAGEAAGEHFDPAATGKHAGPDGGGHAGDLPRITIAADGTSQASVNVPRLKLADARNRSLMVHAGPDDYGQAPGGARIACGLIGG